MVASGGEDALLEKYGLVKKSLYWATPDWADPFNKMFHIAKFSLLFSVPPAFLEVALLPRTATLKYIPNIYAYWVIPTAGIAVTYSAITYISANLRKKDDMLNHAYGALAGGFVFHAWSKQPVLSFWMTTLFVIAAVLKKEAKMEDFPNSDYLSGSTKPTTLLPWRYVPYREYRDRKLQYDEKNYYVA